MVKYAETSMELECYSMTDQGTREYQQDAAYAEVGNGLGAAILCDGMGGLNGGEKASNLGVKHFVRDLKEAWPMASVPGFLVQEAKRLDRMVNGLVDEAGNRLNAGSTMVAAVIEAGLLYWVSVGDSRMYLLRDGSLTCLTAEHNYKTMLREKLEAGQISMDYYEAEIGQGEALTSYLGMGNISLIDVNQSPFSLRENDVLLLCSDGLYKTLNQEQIQALLEESGNDIVLAAERLIQTARRLGVRGQDNTTLILIKYGKKER